MAGLLDGVRVVDLGQSDAAKLAATLLCDLGADGVRIGLSDGLRSVDGILERGRRACADATDAEVERWLARCDVVVDDGELKRRGLKLSMLRAANPGLIAVELPFATGVEGQGSGAAAGAQAGVYAPPLSRRPRWSGLPVAETIAGVVGALGAAAALNARLRDGLGQTVRAPLVDAAYVGVETLLGMGHKAPSAWEGVRWAASPMAGLYRCGDGTWVFVHLGLAHHVDRFLDLLSHEGLIRMSGSLKRALSAHSRRDPGAMGSPAEAREVKALLTELFDARPAAAWEALLGEAGLCCAAVRTGAQWRSHPQAIEGRLVVDVDDPALGAVGQPGPWIQPGAVRPRTSGKPRWRARKQSPTTPDRSLPLAGIRVLDFTQVIAGPVSGRTLAELGADVIRIEHPHFRPAWAEAFHVLFNAGKRSCTVELNRERSRRILETLKPDLVLTAWRAGVDGRLGLDPEWVRKTLPQAIVVRLNAWGQDGPWAGRPGWEQTVQAASGMQADYGGATPELVPLPVNDACTGLVAALGAVAALYARSKGARPATVHTSLAATATWLQRDTLFTPSGRAGRRARGRSLGQGSTRRFVRTADGWLWLEGDVDAVRELVGVDPTDEDGTDAQFATETSEAWTERASAVDGVMLSPWRTLGSAASIPTAPVHRTVQPGLGPVTRVDLCLHLDGTPLRRASVAVPRGAHGRELLDGVVDWMDPETVRPRDIASRLRRRLSWARTTARWGALLAADRLTGLL